MQVFDLLSLATVTEVTRYMKWRIKISDVSGMQAKLYTVGRRGREPVAHAADSERR